jgi:GNAT superfamily N-acetyltransferase
MTTAPRDRAGSADVEIAACLPAHPDAARLLDSFYREQVGRYGFADPIEMNPGEYAPPGGVFAVACRGDIPVGCGGYRWFDRAAGTVEIKKTYVLPAARGHGAGRALLSWLERHAVAAGACRAILETGVRNTAALRLFTASGYRPTDAYVEGRDPAINRAFARSLVRPAQSGGRCDV